MKLLTMKWLLVSVMGFSALGSAADRSFPDTMMTWRVRALASKEPSKRDFAYEKIVQIAWLPRHTHDRHLRALANCLPRLVGYLTKPAGPATMVRSADILRRFASWHHETLLAAYAKVVPDLVALLNDPATATFACHLIAQLQFCARTAAIRSALIDQFPELIKYAEHQRDHLGALDVIANLAKWPHSNLYPALTAALPVLTNHLDNPATRVKAVRIVDTILRKRSLENDGLLLTVTDPQYLKKILKIADWPLCPHWGGAELHIDEQQRILNFISRWQQSRAEFETSWRRSPWPTLQRMFAGNSSVFKMSNSEREKLRSLMIIRRRLARGNTAGLPSLPYEVWLTIFLHSVWGENFWLQLLPASPPK